MDVIDGKWISERLTGRRGEKSELAAYIGVGNDVLTKILKGIRNVQPTEAPLVVKYFEERDGDIGLSEPVAKFAAPGTAMIPVYDVAASAGNGSIVEYEPIADQLAFPRDYLKKLTKSDPRNLAIISVKGDSMEPTLKDDDIVLLDASKTSLHFDGLFVLRFGDALHVKRVTRSAKYGFITILSDNQTYPPQEHAADDVAVIGKVLWYGRKV